MEFWMWSQWIMRSEGLCCRKAEWCTEICSLSRVVLVEVTIWSIYSIPFLQVNSISQLLILLVSEYLGELLWKSCYTYIKTVNIKVKRKRKYLTTLRKFYFVTQDTIYRHWILIKFLWWVDLRRFAYSSSKNVDCLNLVNLYLSYSE